MKLQNYCLAGCATLLALLCLLIAGCVTKVPLSDVDNSTVDQKLVGVWEGDKAGDNSVLVTVVPFDKHGYIVTYSKYQKDGDKIIPKGQITMRAWLTQIGGKDFYTVDIRSPQAMLSPDAQKPDQYFIVGTWAVDGEKLTLTALNVDKHDEIKQAETTEALQKLVTANINDASFLKDFAVYKKASGDHLKDDLAILEKFENPD